MALDIDLEGFGFLESDSDATSKLSPTLSKQQQPPISPIESESSSGISSLDSDDLKKQLLASPTTISPEEDHDEDDDEEASESDSGSSTKSEDVNEKDDEDSDADIKEQEVPTEEQEVTVEDPKITTTSDDDVKVEAPVGAAPVVVEMPIRTQVIYGNRNILNLASNVGCYINFTVLPENNVNCFFQNRAQYWRLANNSVAFDEMEKCSCCDFSYPPQPTNNQGQSAKNAITDSLMTFLKNSLADYQNSVTPAMPPTNSFPPMSNVNAAMHHNGGNNMGNGVNGHQGFNNMNNRRMYNNNNTPYAAYQMIQQQQQQQQQYPNNQQNGYYGNNNNNNNGNAGYNSYNNNNNGNVGGGYNGTALALLNLMNASRNVSGAAFQATLNNSTQRYYNNMNTNNNNGFGLYKQF